METEVLIRRVYDKTPEEGLRVLVDRLWPRGIKKSDLPYDIWAKEITPSTELRTMFHADPEGHWDAFTKGYAEELDASAAFHDFIERIKKEQPQRIILLYAFKNQTKNHAVILQQKIIEALNHEVR
jgi:uncharacterized protein YeaO (DUF488 family)